MDSMKPFDFHYLSKTLTATRLSSYLACGISLACLGGVVSGKVGQKDISWLLMGCGIGATVAARATIETSEDTKFILNDYEDLSAQVRTNVEFKELQQGFVNIPEYNWSLLAGARIPVSVTGDRREAIKVAEWLANSRRGTSLFVSRYAEDIRVSQQIVPGDDNGGSLLDIMSYAINPTYGSLIASLDAHLALREQDSTLRQPLVVILDNPPKIPAGTHCTSLNIFYIVLGQQVPGWVQIKLGQEALEVANKQTSLPYWQEVVKRWSQGTYPCLVNSQFARLPSV